jgi:hypothetical protein
MSASSRKKERYPYQIQPRKGCVEWVEQGKNQRAKALFFLACIIKLKIKKMKGDI